MNEANKKYADMLTRAADLKFNENIHKYNALRNSALSIIRLEKSIDEMSDEEIKDLKKTLPGVGKSSVELILEFKNTGTLEIFKQPEKPISAFKAITKRAAEFDFATPEVPVTSYVYKPETFVLRTLVHGDGNKIIDLTLLEGDIVDKGFDGTIHIALRHPFNNIFGVDKIWINPQTMDIIKQIKQI